MGQNIMIYILVLFLLILRPSLYSPNNVQANKQSVSYCLTPMEALDHVKEEYTTNFTKVSLQENQKDYFYMMNLPNYYLVYEGTDENTGEYLIHLYEFVVDEIDTGIGHTVTYCWYWVDPYTGEIQEYPQD